MGIFSYPIVSRDDLQYVFVNKLIILFTYIFIRFDNIFLLSLVIQSHNEVFV